MLFQAVIIGLLVILVLGVLAIGYLTLRLFNMHNVKNENGEYAFLMPSGYCELPKEITLSQERISRVMQEMLKQSVSQGELLRKLTNEVLRIYQKEVMEDKK